MTIGGSAVLVVDSEVEGGEMSSPSEGAITVEETVRWVFAGFAEMLVVESYWSTCEMINAKFI